MHSAVPPLQLLPLCLLLLLCIHAALADPDGVLPGATFCRGLQDSTVQIIDTYTWTPIRPRNPGKGHDKRPRWHGFGRGKNPILTILRVNIDALGNYQFNLINHAIASKTNDVALVRYAYPATQGGAPVEHIFVVRPDPVGCVSTTANAGRDLIPEISFAYASAN